MTSNPSDIRTKTDGGRVGVCVKVCYLALQVGHPGGELRLSRLWQLSVQTGRHQRLPTLLVLVLQQMQDAKQAEVRSAIILIYISEVSVWLDLVILRRKNIISIIAFQQKNTLWKVLDHILKFEDLLFVVVIPYLRFVCLSVKQGKQSEDKHLTWQLTVWVLTADEG